MSERVALLAFAAEGVELREWARTLSEFFTTGVDKEFTGRARGGGVGGGHGGELMSIASGSAGDRGMEESSAGP